MERNGTKNGRNLFRFDSTLFICILTSLIHSFIHSFRESVSHFIQLRSFEIATIKRVPLLHSHSIQSIIIIAIILVVSSCVNIVNVRLHKYFIAWSRNVRAFAFCRKMITKKNKFHSTQVMTN